jgi:hypothetical protein
MENAVSPQTVNEPRFVDPKNFKKGVGVANRYLIVGLIVLLFFVGVTMFLSSEQGKEVWRKRISIFGKINKESTNKSKEIEKPVLNPLTGEKYTEEESKDWKDIRPLGVMINNHPDARPQAGLIDADFTYEIVAEGGITRFLAFYQSNLPEKVGPVRSTREYYLVLAKEMGDSMLMHQGYSPGALEAINTWPIRSFQQGGADNGTLCPGCSWRENPRNVAIEHTLYANTKALMKRGLELGWEGKSEDLYVWQFKDDGMTYNLMPKADEVSYDFWYKGDFSVMWQYDQTNNSYLRFMGFDSTGKEVPHTDEVTQKQITAKNVVVQFATEGAIAGDEKSRLSYVLTGSGKGYVFMDGRVIDVTWSKASRNERTKYYDINGGEIKFNRGKFWVSIIPDRNTDNLKYSVVENKGPTTAPSSY